MKQTKFSLLFVFLFISCVVNMGCKKELNPRAYMGDPDVQFLESKATELNGKIVELSKSIEDTHQELQRAIEKQENIKVKRTRYFQRLAELEKLEQQKRWVQYRTTTAKKEAQERYVRAELSGHTQDNPDSWKSSRIQAQWEQVFPSTQTPVKK